MKIIIFSLGLLLSFFLNSQTYSNVKKKETRDSINIQSIEKQIDSIYNQTIYDIKNSQPLVNSELEKTIRHLMDSYKLVFNSQSELMSKSIISSDSIIQKQSLYLELLVEHLCFLNEARYQLYETFLNTEIYPKSKYLIDKNLDSELEKENSNKIKIDYKYVLEKDSITLEKISYLANLGETFHQYIERTDSIVKYKEIMINNLDKRIAEKIKNNIPLVKNIVCIKENYFSFIKDQAYLWVGSLNIASGSSANLLFSEYQNYKYNQQIKFLLNLIKNFDAK